MHGFLIGTAFLVQQEASASENAATGWRADFMKEK
jgi:hypothetical protein